MEAFKNSAISDLYTCEKGCLLRRGKPRLLARWKTNLARKFH